MKVIAYLGAAVLIASLTMSVRADIDAIHINILPNDASVADALKDLMQLEPYTRRWTPDWKYPVDKSEAIARLDKDLITLKDAVRRNPENIELLLLTGLAGRYAYNVDVGGVFDSSLSDLSEAARLAPSDVRPSWFRAAILCQTLDQPAEGAKEFLEIEATHDWQQLPSAFWADYMECASVTNMPAHILRAADYAGRLSAPASDEINFLAKTAQKRFDPFDPPKKYASRDIWDGIQVGDDISLTSTTCGLRLRVRGGWEINQLELSKGSCVANFSIGAYRETQSKMRPSILVVVQQPQKNETLENYAKRFMTKGRFEPFTPSRCPTDQCIAIKGVRTGAYGKDGDGYGYMLVFERDQPPFPGLVFETPSQPPQLDASKAAQYYRPRQTQGRIPGKLYYVVLLDTAASIDKPAIEDLDFFLQNLTAE